MSLSNSENVAKKIPLETIPEDSYFSETVYLDSNFVLAAPEMPFNRSLIKALKEWEFREVFCDGETLEDYAANQATETTSVELTKASIGNDSGKIQRAEEFYSQLEKLVEKIYSDIGKNRELDFNSIAEKIKTACEIIKEDRRFLLRVQKKEMRNPNANYLFTHSVNSTITSVIIGAYLKLPNHRLMELGVAALLQDIGMTKLPSQIYLAKRSLEPQERKAILAHPILGFNILKPFNFPLSVTLAILEHHERENGSGYPRALTGNKISLYGKIIAVACSYEALSSQRPHKEAKDGYTGMLELLKNEGKKYDDTVIRALVFSLSIYPIGLYVLLSSGRKGQVVDVNPENPRYPVVQVFGEFTPDGKNKVLETAPDKISIVRPLTREEI
jgi:HD-GYP domain-containing protein (c-di-GMP phosphodiesterase class II)